MDWVLTRRNPYGFRDHCYSLLRLSELIGMQKRSPAFRKIQDDLDDLRKKYLDINYPPFNQMDSIQLIGTELMAGYPDVFQGTRGRKHLYFALSVIVQFHTRERSIINTAARSQAHNRNQNHDDEDYTPSPNNGQSLLRVERNKREYRTSQNTSMRPGPTQLDGPYTLRSKVPQTKVSTRSITRTACPVDVETIDLTSVPSSPARDVKPINATLDRSAVPQIYNIPPGLASSTPPSQSTRSFAGAQRPPLPTRRGTSNTSTARSTSTKEDSVATNQTEIYAFLSACRPSMVQYIQHFVDFGCVTDEHLLSVSQWRKEQRYNLVKDILQSSSGDGVKPTGMDIAILMNQFETYFMEN